MKVGLLLQEGDEDFQTKWNEIALVQLVACTVYFVEYWGLKNFHDLIIGNKALFSLDKPVGKLTERPPKI